MKTIYFVRHGEAEGNVLGITAGSEIDTPLTSKGRTQASRIIKDLANRKVDLIVSSPLSRAFDTATIVARKIGYSPEKIITSPYFAERSIGSMAGRPYGDYKKAFLSNSLPQDVETADAMYGRVAKGLDQLKRLKGNNILLVSHDGFNKALQGVLQGLPSNEIYKIKDLENTQVYKFTL